MRDESPQVLPPARLDEDKDAALAATQGPWTVDSETYAEKIYGAGQVDVVAGGRWGGEAPAFESTEDALHIARHDPTRVLAEVEAKQAILDAYLPPEGDPHPGLPCINYEGQNPADYDEYESCFRHLEVAPRLLRNDYVLRLLAVPYADHHPDYDKAWRP